MFYIINRKTMECGDDECTAFANPGDCVDIHKDFGATIMVSLEKYTE